MTASRDPSAGPRPTPTLIMLVGLPYSGKSTLARRMDAPIVCPDEIRLALHGHRYAPAAERWVWAMADVMVKALFGAGHAQVVLDACSHTLERREAWASPHWSRKFVVMTTPLEVVRQRAAADAEIVEVIDRMASAYQGPELDPVHPSELSDPVVDYFPKLQMPRAPADGA